MKQRLQFWLTGAVAVVLAAASQAHTSADPARASSRTSRFSPAETADRLERQARERGMAVFARIEAPFSHAPAGSLPTPHGHVLLVVFGTEGALTPVLQSGSQAGLDLPMTVRVEQGVGGGTEVVFSDSAWLADNAELPAEWLDRVAALPALVDAALS